MDASKIEDIKIQILNIRKDATSGVSKGDLEKKYVSFCDRYPALFMRCCNPTESLDMVYLMLEKLGQHETAQSAGKEMGEYLVNKYVKPKLAKK